MILMELLLELKLNFVKEQIMALKHTVNFKGIQVQDAYLRVFQFEGNKEKMHIGLEFCKDASSERFDSLTVRDIPFSIDGKNPIAQAYEHVKTLPEFAGAQDC